MSGTWIGLGLLALLVIYIIAIYNKLVRQRTMADEAWSGVDVQLKRRANLVPNLVETVKGYAAHEQGVFEDLARARAASLGADSVKQQAEAETMMGGVLGRLFAVAEAYPDLKADARFGDLQRELSELEQAIEMARRYYNGTVRDLNVTIDSFPSNLVAGQFKFEKKEFFEIDEAARALPEVKF